MTSKDKEGERKWRDKIAQAIMSDSVCQGSIRMEIGESDGLFTLSQSLPQISVHFVRQPSLFDLLLFIPVSIVFQCVPDD